MRLYMDRLELTGWGWRPVQHDVPLDRLDRVEAPSETRLIIEPHDRAPISVRVEEALQWARVIRTFRACLDPPD